MRSRLFTRSSTASFFDSSALTSTNSDGSKDPTSTSDQTNTPKNFVGNPPSKAALDQFYSAFKDLTQEQLEGLQEMFHAADLDGSGGLDEEEFTTAFVPVLAQSNHLTEADIKLWFMRMDSNADGHVTWSEFASYLLTVRHTAETDSVKKRQFINLDDYHLHEGQAGAPADAHHDMITQIILGRNQYITATDDGFVKIWNPETLTPKHTIKNSSTMVSCSVLFPDMKTLLVASIDRVLNFYNVSERNFQCGTLIRRFTGAQTTAPATQGVKGRAGGIIKTETETVDMREFNDAPSALEFHTLADKDSLIIGTYTGGVYIYPIGKLHLPNYPSYVKPTTKMILHNEMVSKIKYCSYLQSLLTASWDKHIHVTDLHTCKISRTLGKIEGHSKSVFSIDWNESMKIISSCGAERDVYVWNPWIESPVFKFKGHMAPIVNIVSNADDLQLISLSRDKVIKVWDLRTNKLFQNLVDTKVHEPDDSLTSLQFDQQRDCILTASTYIQEWPLHRALCNFGNDYSGHSDPPVVCIYNPKFNHIITSDFSRCMCWDSGTGTKLFSFTVKDGSELDDVGKTDINSIKEKVVTANVTCACLDGRKRRLCIGLTNGTILVYNYITGLVLKKLQVGKALHYDTQQNTISNVVYVLKENQDIRYVCASEDDKLYTWRDETNTMFQRYENVYQCQYGQIATIAFIPPSYVACGSITGSVVVINVTQGAEVAYLSPAAEPYEKSVRLTTHPTTDHTECAASEDSSDDDEIKKYSEMIGKKACQVNTVEALVWLDRQELLVVTLGEKHLWFWSLMHKGELLLKYNAQMIQEQDCYCCTYNPQNEMIITADDSGYVFVYDVSGIEDDAQRVTSPQVKKVRYFKAHDKSVINLDWAESGLAIVTCSSDLSIRVWTLDGCWVGMIGQSAPWTFGNESTWHTGTPNKGGAVAIVEKPKKEQSDKLSTPTTPAAAKSPPPPLKVGFTVTTNNNKRNGLLNKEKGGAEAETILQQRAYHNSNNQSGALTISERGVSLEKKGSCKSGASPTRPDDAPSPRKGTASPRRGTTGFPAGGGSKGSSASPVKQNGGGEGITEQRGSLHHMRGYQKGSSAVLLNAPTPKSGRALELSEVLIEGAESDGSDDEQFLEEEVEGTDGDENKRLFSYKSCKQPVVESEAVRMAREERKRKVEELQAEKRRREKEGVRAGENFDVTLDTLPAVEKFVQEKRVNRRKRHNQTRNEKMERVKSVIMADSKYNDSNQKRRQTKYRNHTYHSTGRAATSPQQQQSVDSPVGGRDQGDHLPPLDNRNTPIVHQQYLVSHYSSGEESDDEWYNEELHGFAPIVRSPKNKQQQGNHPKYEVQAYNVPTELRSKSPITKFQVPSGVNCQPFTVPKADVANRNKKFKLQYCNNSINSANVMTETIYGRYVPAPVQARPPKKKQNDTALTTEDFVEIVEQATSRPTSRQRPLSREEVHLLADALAKYEHPSVENLQDAFHKGGPPKAAKSKWFKRIMNRMLNTTEEGTNLHNVVKSSLGVLEATSEAFRLDSSEEEQTIEIEVEEKPKPEFGRLPYTNLYSDSDEDQTDPSDKRATAGSVIRSSVNDVRTKNKQWADRAVSLLPLQDMVKVPAPARKNKTMMKDIETAAEKATKMSLTDTMSTTAPSLLMALQDEHNSNHGSAYARSSVSKSTKHRPSSSDEEEESEIAQIIRNSGRNRQYNRKQQMSQLKEMKKSLRSVRTDWRGNASVRRAFAHTSDGV